ncbi:MAG: hypothetical protein FWD79_12210 [Desulfobulbus sp.]|nr:hypothetical protein [Desulfobulbus sp.]
MQLQVNIRHKILLGLFLPVLCLVILPSFTYSTLLVVEQKIHSLERIDDIKSAILDLRRLEKNLLVYGEEEAYEFAINAMNSTLALFERKDELSDDARVQSMIGALEEDLVRYCTVVRWTRMSPAYVSPGAIQARKAMRCLSWAGNLWMELRPLLIKSAKIS